MVAGRYQMVVGGRLANGTSLYFFYDEQQVWDDLQRCETCRLRLAGADAVGCGHRAGATHAGAGVGAGSRPLAGRRAAGYAVAGGRRR
jgi:hypothetical protein